jgi:hypothetical protein
VVVWVGHGAVIVDEGFIFVFRRRIIGEGSESFVETDSSFWLDM